MQLPDIIAQLPHVNASLNGLATLFLFAGYVAIRKRKERLHKVCMGAAFVTSMLFLVCYLLYHFHVPSKKFPTTAPVVIRYTYYGILLSHVLLAIFVPFLAISAIYYGWRDNRKAHRGVVLYAFPIWVYVSVTGVVVYLMLYQFFPG